MQQQTFTIRKSFLIPLGLIVLLGIVLLLSSLLLELPLAKILILGFFLVPAIILFAESIRRQVIIDDEGVRVNKLFRSKKMTYDDLTSLDTVLVRKRAFVSLSSEEDFIILSNSYGHFGDLLKVLLSKAPEATVSEETRKLAANPPEKSGDIFSAWLAVVVLLLIVFVQLRGAL